MWDGLRTSSTSSSAVDKWCGLHRVHKKAIDTVACYLYICTWLYNFLSICILFTYIVSRDLSPPVWTCSNERGCTEIGGLVAAFLKAVMDMSNRVKVGEARSMHVVYNKLWKRSWLFKDNTHWVPSQSALNTNTYTYWVYTNFVV